MWIGCVVFFRCIQYSNGSSMFEIVSAELNFFNHEVFGFVTCSILWFFLLFSLIEQIKSFWIYCFIIDWQWHVVIFGFAFRLDRIWIWRENYMIFYNFSFIGKLYTKESKIQFCVFLGYKCVILGPFLILHGRTLSQWCTIMFIKISIFCWVLYGDKENYKNYIK